MRDSHYSSHISYFACVFTKIDPYTYLKADIMEQFKFIRRSEVDIMQAKRYVQMAVVYSSKIHRATPRENFM